MAPHFPLILFHAHMGELPARKMSPQADFCHLVVWPWDRSSPWQTCVLTGTLQAGLVPTSCRYHTGEVE